MEVIAMGIILLLMLLRLLLLFFGHSMRGLELMRDVFKILLLGYKRHCRMLVTYSVFRKTVSFFTTIAVILTIILKLVSSIYSLFLLDGCNYHIIGFRGISIPLRGMRV